MGRVVHGPSCLQSELSMVRVVHGPSSPWAELSTVRVVHGPRCLRSELSTDRGVHGPSSPPFVEKEMICECISSNVKGVPGQESLRLLNINKNNIPNFLFKVQLELFF
jgi:hypothetical protein